ncbi:MAG: FHA domain-containing protein [Aggregatilineales bacterium]
MSDEQEQQNRRKTRILSGGLPKSPESQPGQPYKDGTARLQGKREIILVIRGMIERLTLDSRETFQLGRFEGEKTPSDIDLTPYGALDRGVSRLHARLHLQDDYLYITDLGSTNGTYLAGKRLKPNESSRVRKGDELMLGRLPVQVMFR